MKTMRTMMAVAAFALVAACSSTDYSTYSGSPVLVGHGGACRQINGVDLWTVGAPPRPYQVVGYIEDSRLGGPGPMAFRLSTVAAKAKAAGADGIIITSDNREFMGTFSSASVNGWANAYGNFGANGFGMTMPIIRRNSTFLAIKYVSSAPLAHKG